MSADLNEIHNLKTFQKRWIVELLPLFNSPGVSIMVTPLGSLIFKKSRVVPGRLETVA